MRKPIEAYEKADPPDRVSLEADPKLAEAGSKVFLSDMQEMAWKPGPYYWEFGKNGALGSGWVRGGQLRVNGKTPPKGLSMHPPDKGYTRICYALGQKAKTVQGGVAISEDELHTTPSATRFLVMGDGKVLWRSDLLNAHRQTQTFNVDVTSVKLLELRVYVDATSCVGAHACWIDPSVMMK